jgi:hypothetical protein
MESSNFITSNQQRMLEAFELAARENRIVSIIDNHGSGFKFAIKKYIYSTSATKVAFAKIDYRFLSTNISIEVMKQFMNIKLVTKGYKTSDVTKLVYDLSVQVKQNLKGKRILLIFDNVNRLNTAVKLSRFFTILKSIQFKCGIILRTNLNHYEQVATLDEKLLTDFMEMTARRIVLNRNTREDISKLCRCYGVTKKELVDEISTKTSSFTVAIRHIDAILKFSPSTQLELGFF